MPRSSRDLVRSAVGLAVVAPALGLLVLAIALMLDGGASGILAGLVVALLAFGLLAVALGMTYAPVTIAKLLEDDEEDTSQGPPGPNGGPSTEQEPEDPVRRG